MALAGDARAARAPGPPCPGTRQANRPAAKGILLMSSTPQQKPTEKQRQRRTRQSRWISPNGTNATSCQYGKKRKKRRHFVGIFPQKLQINRLSCEKCAGLWILPLRRTEFLQLRKTSHAIFHFVGWKVGSVTRPTSRATRTGRPISAECRQAEPCRGQPHPRWTCRGPASASSTTGRLPALMMSTAARLLSG